MTKVSIIIPFYNQKTEYIKDCLNSVLNQSMRDIEVICVDDGSDGKEVYDYISALTKTDNRIKIFSQEHSGAGNARNTGIKQASGENIMFLDSDDFYPSDSVLETLYNLKKEFNVQISGGKHLILNNGSYEEPYFNYGDINHFFCNKKVRYSDYQFPWWYWCCMFETSLIRNNNIFFPPYLRYQDPPFFVRVMNKAEVFYAADFVSYIHRNSNKIFNMTSLMAKDHVRGVLDVLKYSKENNLKKLNSLLYDLFFSFDVVNILQNADGLTEEEINKMKDMVKNI